MIRVLIVDDEIYVTRMLQKNISWSDLGVDEALIAFNASKAKEIMEKNNVDILVTDIEMPGESGLDLAEWTTDQNPACRIIFLTSHAEFTYAQQAMKYRALEYILKPIEFDQFSELIRKAVKEIEQEQSSLQKEKHGEQWENLSEELKESFWSHLLVDEGISTPEVIQQKADKYGVQVDFTRQYQLVLLVPRDVPEKYQTPEGRSEMEELLSNLAEDILEAEYPDINYGWVYHRMWILLPEEKSRISDGVFENIIQLSREMLETGIVIYRGSESYIEELGPAFRSLLESDRDNVSMQQGIFIPVATGGEDEVPAKFWVHVRESLAMGEYRFLREELQKYDPDRFHVSSRSLFFTILNYQYELQRHLENLGLNVRDFYNEEEREAYLGSFGSLENCRKYLSHILKKLEEQNRDPDSAAKQSEIIRTVKEYIHRNICEKIKREDIAEAVHFSPDYIARLFREEEGKSLNKYIMEQKTVYACTLMKEHPEKNVGDIAVELGYSSFSYFSEIFKRFTGYLPSEYQRICASHNRTSSSDEK